MTTVLVTDGDQRSALAAVRSFGAAGYHVVVGESFPRNLASVSRFCDERIVYPTPYGDETAFVDAVAAAAAVHAVDFIIPMTDITSAILADHRAKLPTTCRLATVDAETFWRASDKIALHRLAIELGVPSPTTHVLTPPFEPAALDDVEYPCIVKPARSRLKTATGWIATAVVQAEDRAALNTLVRTTPALRHPFMIQRRIEGPGIGVFALCEHGEPRAMFSHRRIREKPPWGGVSVLREATPVDPTAGAYAKALLRALSWHGVAMVEFKREQRTGVPFLMEINGRFWGSLQLAIDAGLDFPAWLVRLHLGLPLPPTPHYRTGVRSRWLLGDLDHLLIRFKTSGEPLVGAPSLTATVRDFCKFWQKGTYYEIESLSDPGPSLYEIRRYARQLVGRST